MVTVLRESGLRVVIFLDDHEPAHVFGDGHAKINLTGPDGLPNMVWAEGMKRNEAKRAYAVVVANQAMLLRRWEEIHG